MLTFIGLSSMLSQIKKFNKTQVKIWCLYGSLGLSESRVEKLGQQRRPQLVTEEFISCISEIFRKSYKALR